MDIMNSFPNAQTVREYTEEGLRDWLFERRLELLKDSILMAAAHHMKEIDTYLTDDEKDFLIEQSYEVTEKDESNNYEVSWAISES